MSNNNILFALRSEASRRASRLGRRKITIIAVCVVFIIAAAVVFLLLRTGGVENTTSAEGTSRAALDAYLSFDSEKMQSLFPEKYIRFAAEKYYGGNTDGFKTLLRSNAAENRREFESRYGTWSYSDVTVKSSREYTADQVSALNEDFEALGLDLHVRAAAKIKLSYSLNYVSHDDARQSETRTYEAFVIKVGARWYLFDE